jgi:hypothetical protein
MAHLTVVMEHMFDSTSSCRTVDSGVMSYRAVVVIEDDEMTYNVAGAGHDDVLVVDLRGVDAGVAAERCRDWLDAIDDLDKGDAVRRYVEELVADVKAKTGIVDEEIAAEQD